MTVTTEARPAAAVSPAPAELGRQRALPPLPGADALRALAAVAVVVVHAVHWPLQDAGADQRVWMGTDLVARFCVPAFVVLAGLLVGYRQRPPGPRWLLRRVRRSLVPWLAWAPVFCLTGLYLTGDVTRSWWGVGDWWSGGAGHLYFLVLVPQLYLLAMLWPRRRSTTIAVAVLAVALQTALSVDRLYGPVGGTAAQGALLWHAYDLFPFWIGYFGVGIALGRHLAEGGRSLPALPFLAAIPAAIAALVGVDVATAPQGTFAAGSGAFLRPLLPPLVLAIAGATLFGAPALLRRRPWLARTASTLSRHSLGIYIVHPLLLAGVGVAFSPLTQRHLPVSVAGAVLDVAVTLILAVALARLLSATPLAPLVGAQRPPRPRPGSGVMRSTARRRRPPAPVRTRPA